MNRQEKLAGVMAGKTNQELLEMFPRANDWTPEALDAARGELQKRNTPIPPDTPEPTNSMFRITAMRDAPVPFGRRFLFGVLLPLGVLIGTLAIHNALRHRVGGPEGGFEQLGRGIATLLVLAVTFVINFIAACMPFRSLDSLLFITLGSVTVGVLFIITA